VSSSSESSSSSLSSSESSSSFSVSSSSSSSSESSTVIPSGGLFLFNDNSGTVETSTLETTAAALVDGNTDIPLATEGGSKWSPENSYGVGFSATPPDIIEGFDIWCYHPSSKPLEINQYGSYWTAGVGNTMAVYLSNDNANWKKFSLTQQYPAIYEVDTNKIRIRWMFEYPSGAKFYKFWNTDNSITMSLSAGVADIQPTEIEFISTEETPTCVWSASAQHPDYNGAMRNPVVAIKQLNTASNQIIATTGRSSGKYYFEILATGGVHTNSSIGIRENQADLGQDYSGLLGSTNKGYSYLAQGRFYKKGSLLCNDSPRLSWALGAYIIGVYVDLDNWQMWFTRNFDPIYSIVNSTNAGYTGDPETGTDAPITGITPGTYYPAVNHYYSVADSPTSYTILRLNARASNIIHLPVGSIFSPWDS
jgi:hypothetical protein